MKVIRKKTTKEISSIMVELSKMAMHCNCDPQTCLCLVGDG